MKNRKKNHLPVTLRKKILELAYQSGSHYPHIGSCLSAIDLMIQTWVYEMKEMDKFILSKGHASLALYVVLHYLKKISDKDLSTYFKDGTYFGVHPPSVFPDFIPLATGSLGHGVSFAAGLAKAQKLREKNQSHVYCLISDGECNEGSVWEAAMFASYQKLDNLIVLIDKNGFQATGQTKDVLGDCASQEKWEAFGFNVMHANGHSLPDLSRAFKEMSRRKNHKPSVIIASTVRGKGIAAIENKLNSNYFHITKEAYLKALKDIESMI